MSLLGIPWYVYALVSAGFIGIKTVLQKAELKKEHSLDYVVAFSLVTMLISFFLWPWVNLQNIDSIGLIYTYAASALGSIAIWLGAKALRHLEVSFVAPQTVGTTIFSLLFAYLLLGEHLAAPQWLGVGVLLASGILLTKGSFAPTHSFGWPAILQVGNWFDKKKVPFFELLLVISMILFGLATVFDKIVLARMDVITFIFLIGIFLFINHLILYWAVVGNVKQIPAKVDHLGWLIVVIGVVTILSRLTYAQALDMADLSLVMPIKKTSILISVIWGGKLFKEKHLTIRIIVAIFMLLGVWLLVR